MRRFNKLKKSFPFLANFHIYRVSFVSLLAEFCFRGHFERCSCPHGSGWVRLGGGSARGVVVPVKVLTKIEGRVCVCERAVQLY